MYCFESEKNVDFIFYKVRDTQHLLAQMFFVKFTSYICVYLQKVMQVCRDILQKSYIIEKRFAVLTGRGES